MAQKPRSTMSGFTGRQIKDDSITGADVDEETLALPSFLVYGKNGPLTDLTSPFQVVTTNGSQNGKGWRIPLGGEVTHLSVQFDSTSYGGNERNLTIELYKNGLGTGKILNAAVSGDGDFGAHGAINPELFVAGDQLALYVYHSDTGITTSDIAAIIRVVTIENSG